MLRLLTGLGVLLVIGSMLGCCTMHRPPTGCVGGACGVGDDCCAPRCHHGFLSPLEDLLCCGSGCGEVYWDEWLSDPPDCCDPCDNCGNWIGPQGVCGSCAQPLNRCNLWGQRHGQDCCAVACGDTCSGACGGECGGQCGGGMHYGEPMGESWSEFMDAPGLPTPATPPTRAAAGPRPRNVFQQIIGPSRPPARNVRAASRHPAQH